MSNSNLAQSGWNTTLVFVGAALVALGVTLYGGLGGSSGEIEEIGRTGESYFEVFDSTKAVSLQVTAFDAKSARPLDFKVERNSQQQWVIPSHHNYPADAQDRLGATAASVMGMKRGALETRWEQDHAKYGVVNPRQESLSIADVEGVGTRITIMLEDTSDAVVDVIVGKKVEGQPSDYFVRAPEEDEVYITTLSNIDLSAKFADWINTDLLEVQGGDINQVTIYDYAVDESEGTLSETEVSLLNREDSTADWQLEGLEDEALEVDPDALTDIISTLDNFEIAGVRPKQEGLTADLALDMELILAEPAVTRNSFAQRMVGQINQDLLRRGFRLQPGQSGAPDDISLLALQGELQAGTSEGLAYRLYFGRAFAGSQDELEIGLSSEEEAAKDAETETAAEADSPESQEEKDVEALDTPLELEPNIDESEVQEVDPANQPGRYVFVRVAFDESLLGGRPEKPVEPEKPALLKAADETQEQGPEAPSAEKSEGDPEVPSEDGGSCQEEPEEPAEEPAEEPETVEDPAEKLEAVRLQYESELNAYQAALQGYETELVSYEKKLTDGQQKAEELNRRFALWYYVIPGDQYDKLRLSRPQLIREKTDEPEVPAGGLPGGLPGGFPGGNLPPGLNLPQ